MLFILYRFVQRVRVVAYSRMIVSPALLRCIALCDGLAVSARYGTQAEGSTVRPIVAVGSEMRSRWFVCLIHACMLRGGRQSGLERC